MSLSALDGAWGLTLSAGDGAVQVTRVLLAFLLRVFGACYGHNIVDVRGVRDRSRARNDQQRNGKTLANRRQQTVNKDVEEARRHVDELDRAFFRSIYRAFARLLPRRARRRPVRPGSPDSSGKP